MTALFVLNADWEGRHEGHKESKIYCLATGKQRKQRMSNLKKKITFLSGKTSIIYKHIHTLFSYSCYPIFALWSIARNCRQMPQCTK